MKCTVNGQVVDCSTLGPLFSWIFPGIFILIGLLFLIKPDWFVKYQIWSMKFFGFGEWKPSKRVSILYRIFGLVFLIVGIIIFILVRM